MPYFEAQDGTELFFSDLGNPDGPAVILIHGWPASSAMWEYQSRVLVDAGFRVITYDRRGFGRSDHPGEGYEYTTMTEDLATLIDDLELDKVSLVGFSMGGGEVARYIGTFGSEKVSKAVFISAVTPFLLKTNDNPEGLDEKIFTDTLDKIKKDRFAFLQTFGEQFYGRTMVHHTVSQALLDWNFAMCSQACPIATVECAKAWSSTDFRDDLLKIDVPTLVIHGTGDATVPIDASGRRTAKMVPGAELLEYDGEPHGLFATVPDKLNEDLIRFLRS